MTDTSLDPRIHAYRADLADTALKGLVDAAAFVEADIHHISVPSIFLRDKAGEDQPVVTQGLIGEHVAIFEIKNGWAWGQLLRDKYVGYMPISDLSPGESGASRKVVVKHSHIYPQPNIKTLPKLVYNLGARLTGEQYDEKFFKTSEGNFIINSHLAALDHLEDDFVSSAENFTGAPYLWGGKTSFGLDCSGLIQIALQACGIEAPRDSDMQARQLGRALSAEERNSLKRGDLVFWKGHVGVMCNEDTLLHANGHHMLVVQEDFKQAVARISSEYGELTQINRL